MGRKSVEYKFLFILVLAAGLLGIQVLNSLLDEPVEAPLKKRDLASVQDKYFFDRPTSNLAEAWKGVNFDFDCEKEINKKISVRGALLQIRGKGCQVNNEDLLIVNESNGYTASIFLKNNREFQTDLIQLIEGENQIFIQFQNAHGVKTEQRILVQSTHI